MGGGDRPPVETTAAATSSDRRLELRQGFDRVADRYGDLRPPLPEGWVEALEELAGLGAGARVLELGCGPGRATAALAERGHAVLAVELGPALAAEATRRLRPFPAVEVVHADGERWPVAGTVEPFDVVLAADAWHWLDPDTRVARAAELLRPGGTLAVVTGRHVAGGDRAFFEAAQRCYERHVPGTPPGLGPPEAGEVPNEGWGLAEAPAFGAPAFRRWVTEAAYTTEAYLGLLGTFSSHLALPDEDRAALFACLARLLEEHGGRVRRTTLTELCAAPVVLAGRSPRFPG